MRTITAVLVMLGFLARASIASADVSGVYDVKFEEVSTNCQSPLKYPHGKITVTVKGNALIVDVDRTPRMHGLPHKNNKISAKSKLSATMIDGMLGVFSVAGKVTPEGQLSIVMVGEYSAQGKPLCTQSWNVIGPRGAAAPKK